MSEPKRPKGFAALSPEHRAELARMGGKAASGDTRSFSVDRKLACAAGRKGGSAVPAEKRSFTRDPTLAANAGRKGGLARAANAKAQKANAHPLPPPPSLMQI